MSDSHYRAFFAIEPVSPVRQQLVSLMDGLRDHITASSVRWTHPDKLHFTLRYFKHLNSADIPGMIQRIVEGLKHIASFQLSPGWLDAFPSRNNPRILVLHYEDRPAALTELVRLIGEAASFAGYGPDRPFRPHVTLGRLQAEAVIPWNISCATLVEAMPVNEIVLFRSVPASQGSYYLPLARLPFGPVAEGPFNSPIMS